MFSLVGLVIICILISSLTAQSDTNSATESLSADKVVIHLKYQTLEDRLV